MQQGAAARFSHMVPDGEMRAERDDAPPGRAGRTIALPLVVAALIVLAVIALWLMSASSVRQPPLAPNAEAPPPRELALPSQPALARSEQHPVAIADQPLRMHEVPAALGGLLGTKATTTFLQMDDFPRRFAATADSLAREHSPAAVWPVLPTPGRFMVEERPEGTVIAPGNAARYTPLVLLAGTVDVPRAVQLYRRLYPLLQQAYRDLGFGDRYLNDRLVEVVDLLLATPDAPEAARLVLLPVKGPVPSLQPWVRYQFADPGLEALSAGQKILVRVGPVNQLRLKAKLAEFRRELTGAETGAK